MELDLKDLIQRSIYLGTFEPFETRVVASFLSPGMTVIDVGANVGYYTALASSKVGFDGNVIAVEPAPRPFARLKDMIVKNHLTARAFNFGLGEKSGKEGIYQSPDSSNDTPTMVAHGGLSPMTTVEVRSLDDCLDDWRIRHVDLLKIDVEGWEPRVVAGASRALASGRIGAILCEFNGYWLRANGSSSQTLLKTLMHFGFQPTGDVNCGSAFDRGITNLLLVRRR
jgi:FkbM family methyltransferase